MCKTLADAALTILDIPYHTKSPVWFKDPMYFPQRILVREPMESLQRNNFSIRLRDEMNGEKRALTGTRRKRMSR